MNDRPAASIAFTLFSEIIPASATMTTSVRRCAAMNALITGSIVVVSALLPSNALTISGNPAASVNRPTVIWGLQATFLGEPGLAEPVTGVGLEVQGCHVVDQQGRRSQADMVGAQRRQPLSPRIGGVRGQ